MIIYPAIDLRQGKVVRLREGDPRRQQIFSQDPRATAKAWIDQGARWIHMVNLDGAFGSANDNLRVLESVAGLGVKLQFGGGLRDMAALRAARDAGAARMVIGTLAVTDPAAVDRALEAFGGEAICVALDARDGKITTKGWTEASWRAPAEFGRELRRRGVRHALYTDVSRDGLLGGADVEGTIALGTATGLEVIASGGVSDLRDIQLLSRSGSVAGAVIGMALYQNRISLAEAISAAEESAAC